jgi:hypothetical protein
VVEDEQFERTKAIVVLIDENVGVVSQAATVIGGGDV